MSSPTEHHPQGPSQIKALAKCCGLIPTESAGAAAEEGTLGHHIWATGARFLASNFPELLELVDKLDVSWGVVFAQFCLAYPQAWYSVCQSEVRLEHPTLNFGTCDKLVLTQSAALIGDAKFGAWSVDPASTNLQGINYAVLVALMYPTVQEVWVWFGCPRREEYSLAKFSRTELLTEWEPKLFFIIWEAQNPIPGRFNYDPVNCTFCSRIECPARLGVANRFITMPHDPKKLDIEELRSFKIQTNSLKTLIDQVDKEAKKRIIEDGEELKGYEIKEKVRRRVIYGQYNVNKALNIIESEMGQAVTILLEDYVELSFSSVEKLCVDFAGGNNAAQPLIIRVKEVLEANNLLTTETFHYIAAIKE